MLEVVETFLSIQGEGKFSGRLAIFIRLFGCNLNCIGFDESYKSLKNGEILKGCDTIRAVYTSHFSATKFQNAKQILKIIKDKCKNLNQKPIVVITGGEPLLHHKNQILLELLEELMKQRFEIQFETNATIFVDFNKFNIYKKCTFAMSVKLKNSGESETRRINPRAIINISQNAKSFYKFVISGRQDELEEIKDILKIYKNEVWCMPLGADRIKLQNDCIKVAEFAIKNGFNYSDRLHIRLWDKKEGV